MRARMLLALVAGCGSPAGVIASAQDASVDHVDAAFDWDAAPADANTYVAVCPDGGSFITIDGDGPTQTLRSNNMPPVFYFAMPDTPWAQAYYVQGIAIGGSDNPDGGASIRFDVEIKENADGGLTDFGPDPGYSNAWYIRQDGTSFPPTSGVSASMTLTQADPGGFVAGSYTATVVSSDAGALSLSGTFMTCRLPDFIGPTPRHP